MNKSHPTRHRPPMMRRGMTLIELLVVVSMLIILVSVLTAAMQPVLAGKEIREAARGLNAYIAASVARAAETGRPAGVWIQRSAANPNAAFDIFFAEVPPLYAGNTTNAKAIVITSSTVETSALMNNVTPSLFQVGDLIRFNYQGPYYPITSYSGSTLKCSTVGKPVTPLYSNGVPFQIQRQPRKSPISPMQLPANTVIDLAISGIGNTGTQFNVGASPVVIMFRPDGSVDQVYSNGSPIANFGSVHLLVGRPDQVGQSPGNLGAAPNDNRWISINRQTGRVITTENMGGTITNARRFATAGQGMGGS